MKIVPSNLSPTGWALLVLAGGCLLAIPFFKRPTEQSKYIGVGDVPTRKTGPREVASSKGYPTKQLNSSQAAIASTSSISNASSPIVNQLGANPPGNSVGRVSNNSDLAETSPAATGSSLGPATARASIDVLPPPASPDQVTSLSAIHSLGSKDAGSKNAGSGHAGSRDVGAEQPGSAEHTVHQPSNPSGLAANRPTEDDTFGQVAPLNAEFPDWAKKPSLLDSVLSGKDSSARPPETIDARKPSSYQSWADQPSESVVGRGDVLVDRGTPFGALKENTSLTSPSADAKFQWPDEDPRSAVPLPKPPERLVGRDAVIRDPALLAKPQVALPMGVGDSGNSGNAPARAPAVLSSGVTGDRFQADSRNLIVQPQFGQKPSAGSRSAASLRKYLPPDDQMIIRQPKSK